MNLVQIKELATVVRQWAEMHQRKVGHRYDFDACDLACMCAYASTVLLAYLHHHGITQAELVVNDAHAFIAIGDHVVDITATQFRHKHPELKLKSVEVCKRKSLMKKASQFDRGMWSVQKRAPDLSSAFELLRPKKHDPESGFPESQYWSQRHQMQKVVRNAIAYCDRQLIKDNLA